MPKFGNSPSGMDVYARACTFFFNVHTWGMDNHAGAWTSMPGGERPSQGVDIHARGWISEIPESGFV